MSALGLAAAAVLAVSVQGMRCTDRLSAVIAGRRLQSKQFFCPAAEQPGPDARVLEPGDHVTDKCEIISGHGEKL